MDKNKLEYFLKADACYVNRNAGICMSRWAAIIVIMMAAAAILDSLDIMLLAIAAGAFSLVQYWANLKGLRILISAKLNEQHGKHYKRFMKRANEYGSNYVR